MMHHRLPPPRPRFRTEANIETRVELEQPRFVRNWLSADLGQANDYSALLAGQTFSATERTYQRAPFECFETLLPTREVRSYRIVAAHRPALGTTYPAVAAQVAAFLESLPDADLIVDGTGVGKAVVDVMRARGLRPIAITITGGLETNEVSPTNIRVPKAELVSTLIAVSQEDRLRIAPELPLRDVLVQEIAAFGTRISATGHTSYEGRDGVHDDLVLAAAIGIWHQERPRPQPARSLRIDHFSR